VWNLFWVNAVFGKKNDSSSEFCKFMHAKENDW